MDNISRDTQYLQIKDFWSSLPLSKKAEMIKAAVKNGIYDLPTIRQKYNEFAEGGDTIDVEGYPLVSSDSVGLTEWFKNNPKIAGMAIGAGLNGIDGERRVVISPLLTNPAARNSLYRNESYRHFFDAHNTPLPEITDVQRKAYIGTPYEGLDRRIQETEAARYLSGDPSHHLNEAQKTQLSKFRFTYPGGTLPEVTITGNKHRFGGNLFAEGGNTSYDDKLIDFVIQEEGFLKDPEDIGDGKQTLGSGLTAKKWHDLYRQRGNKWSEEDNRMAVAEELSNRRRWVEKNVPNWDILPEDSKNAMLSYKYNYDFNAGNSPNMYAALRNRDWEEAARQMDATSKDPKFKKGLADRRAREQMLFLEGFVNSPLGPVLPKTYADQQEIIEPVSIRPLLQTPKRIDPRLAPIMVPDKDRYVSIHRITQEDADREKEQKVVDKIKAIDRFNKMMDKLSVENTATPAFVPYNPYVVNSNADGGSIYIKPSHRGRLTELKKRTGKTEAELYNDGNPAHKKMVVFARNARRWKHGLGGNLFDGSSEESQQMEMGPTIDGGTLREVVIRRSEDPVWILGQRNPAIQKALWAAYEKEDTSEDVDDSGFPTYLEKPQATRLLEVYKKAKNPKIKSLSNGKHRAYYNPLTNTMHVDTSKDYEETFNDIIAELAHPLQAKYGNNAPWKEHVNVLYDSDAYKDATRYNYPETYEGETHGEFEPLLNYYIDQHIIPGQTWITGTPGIGYGELVENPTLEQVIDSAKVYNNRRQESNYKYPDIILPQRRHNLFTKIRDWKL